MKRQITLYWIISTLHQTQIHRKDLIEIICFRIDPLLNILITNFYAIQHLENPIEIFWALSRLIAKTLVKFIPKDRSTVSVKLIMEYTINNFKKVF